MPTSTFTEGMRALLRCPQCHNTRRIQLDTLVKNTYVVNDQGEPQEVEYSRQNNQHTTVVCTCGNDVEVLFEPIYGIGNIIFRPRCAQCDDIIIDIDEAVCLIGDDKVVFYCGRSCYKVN